MEIASAFRELPKIRMKNKVWYFDARLNQLRNVENPSDYYDLAHDETEVMELILALSEERPLQVADEDASEFGQTLWEQNQPLRDSTI